MSGLRTYKDAVVLMTGGASGIGAAMARELAHRGAIVVLADRQVELAGQIATEIEASGGRASAVELDVSDPIAFDAVVKSTCDEFGRLDYLFNNAGVALGGEVKDHELEDWQAIINVNINGVVYGVQAAYRRMIEQGFGHIINTASVAGLGPTPGATAYSMTKYAVTGLSLSLRLEAQRHGVRVTSLNPGVIRTPILTGGKYGRITGDIPLDKAAELWERARPMPADRFAKKVIDQVVRNPAVIVVPGWWKMPWFLGRLSLTVTMFFMRRGFEGMQAELEKAR